MVSDAARILFIHTPGPTEAQSFYLEASEPHAAGDDAREPDFARVRAAAQNTGGMTLLGPPPFAVP